MKYCMPIDYTNHIKRGYRPKKKGVHIDTRLYRIHGELSAAEKLKLQLLRDNQKAL